MKPINQLRNYLYRTLLFLLLAMGLLGCGDPTDLPPLEPTDTPTAAVVETSPVLGLLPTPPEAPLERDPLSTDFSAYQFITGSTNIIEPPAMTTFQEAALAVVRIRGCDLDSRCVDTNQGSGAIIHPSGIILTAWHVTVLNPQNRALPDFYDHFLIEITNEVSESPQPRYYARWIAYNTQDDLALLRIVGEYGQSQEEWEQPMVDLPWLPISSDKELAQPDLLVMGYPLDARTINFPSYRFNSLVGSEIRIPDAISKGFSGGPTLVQNNDSYEIVGIVSSRVQEETLISRVQQLESLIWLPKEQMWAENAQIVSLEIGGKRQSQLEATVHTLGYQATEFDPLADLLIISDEQGNKARQRLQATNFVNIQQLKIPLDPNSKLFNQPLFVSIFDLAEGEVWRVEEWVIPETAQPEATSTPTAVDTPPPTATSPPDIPTPTLTAAASTATPIPPTSTSTPAPTATEPAEDLTFSCTAVSEIPQLECEALVAIYESTYGPGWNKSDVWLQNNTPCSWHGIECLDGYVDQIGLQHNNLLGELPPEIRHLTTLRSLTLFANQITTIPPDIEKLVNLKWLYIADNELQNLPAEIFSLPRLTLLSLNSNPLESLPAELGNLTELRKLYLRNTSLSRLPSTISKLAKLSHLDISANNFSTVPSEIWSFRGLQNLNLSENQLSAIPPEIGSLTNLETLDLSENLLRDLPVELANLARLSELDVGQNNLVELSPTLRTFLDEKDLDWTESQVGDIPSPPTTTLAPSNPTLGTTYVNPADGATYVYVPADEFIMGSSDEQVDYAFELCNLFTDCQRSWFEDEQPQHIVYLDSYWIMQTEVTNAQYRKFMAAEGYTTKAYWSSEGWAWRGTNTEPSCWNDDAYISSQQPIICISWYEAEAYANWLSVETGLEFGLPTEAQWEKAARGIDGRNFPWGNQWDGSFANFCDTNCTRDWADRGTNDGYQYAAPVGSYPENRSLYGMLDMAGNVWEWTADWYAQDYYQSSPSRNPVGPASGTNRVLRGGSLSSGANDLRASFRRGSLPGDEVINVGVRLRLSSPPQFRHLQPTATFTIKPTSTLTSIPTLLTPTPVLPTATFTPIPPTPPTPTLGTSSIYVNSVDGATYVYVPAGEFIMGSSDEQVNKAYDLCETYYGDCNLHVLKDSQPQQSVYLDSYWIMQTEVTNAQYRKFMDAGGYTIETYWSPEGWAWRTKNNVTEPEGYWTLPNFSGAEQPIMDVSWYEAEAYANWLSETSGIDFGLPTEAQWEKAARGTDGRSFPWGNQWDGSRANHCDKNCPDEWGDKESDDGTPQTAPAGSYSTGASPYGALDMVGNVWEWTADWYSYGYDEASPNNPTGPENGDTRVVRGGSWRSDPAQASATIRGRSWTPDNTLYTIGFRLVRRAEN